MRNQEPHDSEAPPQLKPYRAEATRAKADQVASMCKQSTALRSRTELPRKIGPLDLPVPSHLLLRTCHRTGYAESNAQKIQNRTENIPKTHRFCEQSLTCSKQQLLGFSSFRTRHSTFELSYPKLHHSCQARSGGCRYEIAGPVPCRNSRLSRQRLECVSLATAFPLSLPYRVPFVSDRAPFKYEISNSNSPLPPPPEREL